MNIQKCARCKTRPAVVFITRLENGKSINEGLCLVCASQLGIKPIDDMLKKMGVNEEDLENMTGDMSNFLDQIGEDNDGGAPAVDLPKIFGDLGLPFNGEGSKKGKAKGAKAAEPDKEQGRKFLHMYATSLFERAVAGKLDRMIGREREIDRVVQILCRRQKNNPCLIGEPGVGKTAIAEALAERIVEGKVPERLRECEVWLLDLTALVAGTQFRGQFEQRILGLIKEVKHAGNIILMIDEVHNIVGAGDSEGSMSAANILKPALSRGEIQVIGATTLKEYRKYIEKDSALERRFQPVMIEEPTIADATDIIKGIKKYYEDFHGVSISEDIARYAVVFSERYITDRFLPDKAIDLIDEAASRRSLDSKELNEWRKNEKEIARISNKIEELEGKVEAGENQNESNYKAIADLKVEKIRLSDRQAELEPTVKSIQITVDDLAQVVEIWTGIPATDIKKSELSELLGLEERISKRIIGQSQAVSAVVRAVKRKRAGVSYRKNPVSFIFAGPTGVGKTELVKVLTEELFRQPDALIRLDMSEYMEKHSVSKIIGAPPGYVGYDEAGQLTEKVRRHPYSVILFDEIEKAHPDVLNILLQVLDDGEISDAQGRKVNFENTIIIMTTNAGSDTSSAIFGFNSTPEKNEESRTEKALSSFLRPEFINRIDEIITFRHLNHDDFYRIADLLFSKLSEYMKEQKNVTLDCTPEVLSWIAEKSYSEKFGARNMRRFLEKNVEDKLAEAIIHFDGVKMKEAHFILDIDELSLICH